MWGGSRGLGEVKEYDQNKLYEEIFLKKERFSLLLKLLK